MRNPAKENMGTSLPLAQSRGRGDLLVTAGKTYV